MNGATVRRLLVILVVLTAACTPTVQGTGTLKGHVTLGPLVPVVREGEPEPTPAPEVYAARQIVVYAEDGRTEIERAQIDPDGNYRVALPPGNYVVDINRTGIDHADGLPKRIEILSGGMTHLDVDIDTGIR